MIWEPKPTGSVSTLGEGANFNAKSLIDHNEKQAYPSLKSQRNGAITILILCP